MEGRLDISVLYVEDELVTRGRLVSLLEREVVKVMQGADGREGLEQYLAHRPDVVVTDIRMPVMDGITMAREIRKADPQAEIIITSAHNEAPLLLNAIEAGVAGYLLKPVDARELIRSIRKVSERERLRRALKKSEQYFKDLVEQAADALLVIDLENLSVLRSNHQACELLGYPGEELLGLSLSRIEVFKYEGEIRELFRRLTPGSPVTVEFLMRRNDGSMVPVETRIGLLQAAEQPLAIVHLRDISERKLAELERERLIVDLQKALTEIKTLRGIIPICSSCKKVRDDQGYWKQVEVYVREHTSADFTHGICPDCMARLYPKYMK